MKIAELRTTDGRTLLVHPRLAVVEADESTRGTVVEALTVALNGGGPCAGLVEVHGMLLDLDRATLRLLDVDPGLPLVLGTQDIPAEAFGPSGRRLRAADDVALKHRELVDARKQQVQGALAVVDAAQAARRVASEEREQAAVLLGEAEVALAEAVASREAAERAVEALADAVDDDPEPVAEAVSEPLGPIAAPTEEPTEVDQDESDEGDRWEQERTTRAHELAAAEARVVLARSEVEAAARAANPARLSASDRNDLEAAHDAVRDADDKASKRFGGSGARRKLDEAKAAERAVLDRLGLDSYSDFLLRSSMGSTDPSAELRLEIARTELMDAETALPVARSAAASVPAPPPPRPARVATPTSTPNVAPAPLAAVPLAAVASGDAAARLAAATRAREDTRLAEDRAQADRDLAYIALADADMKVMELTVRNDEAEQALAQARVRVDAALQEAADTNGHPSAPSWGEATPSDHAVADELDRHLLSWLAARGQHPLAGPLPIVLDETYRHVTGEDLDALLLRLDHMADSLHVVYMTDDPKVLQWAASLPRERAGIVVLPGAGGG
jgi:hypothetical protein